MQGKGQIVAVDLPGKRIARLEENLSTLRSEDLKCEIVENGDLLEMDSSTFEDKRLTSAYDAVMLDAPCSNTGVIQRRTDVKWRLHPKDIENCAKLQLQLLHSAARFVKAGGRITYSTCNIEAIENQLVVDEFLASKSGRLFKLEKAISAFHGRLDMMVQVRFCFVEKLRKTNPIPALKRSPLPWSGRDEVTRETKSCFHSMRICVLSFQRQ